jgi:type I restriction enzyme S subunit
MDLKTFIDNFHLLAGTPNAIPKLHEMILQLAVRGKLVPQDSNDEPASVLLEKINAEKDRFIAEGKIKKSKPLPPIKSEEVPYGLPEGWQWVRLGDVTTYGITEKVEPGGVVEGTWTLELEDIEKTSSKLLVRVRYPERDFKSTKNLFSKGDVLYGKLRPYLDKVLVADEPGVCTTEIMPIRGYFGIDIYYLRYVLKSPDFISYANSSTHGMNLPRLGTDKARSALFQLPPFNEQKRIVSKVDELLALCDELETKLRQCSQVGEDLMEAVVNQVTEEERP